MNKKQLLVLITGIATIASSVYAQEETFRTLAGGTGIYQATDPATLKPVYGVQGIFGHDLVSAALGVPLATVLTNQVLALQVDCGSTTASLVVFDKVSSNNIATIAVCTNLSVVQTVVVKGIETTSSPNREHFMGQFAVASTNNLLGGYLTIAGRLQLDPTNGCPRAIKVEVDLLDRLFMDTDNKNADDPKNDDILRAGVGHAVGAVTLIFDNSTTNQVLLPFEALSIRHQLD